MKEKVGIICGKGKFPLYCAEEARKTGQYEVVALAIRDYADESIKDHSDEIYWFGVGQVGKLIKTSKRAGIKHLTFAGKIDHVNLLKLHHFDTRALSILSRLPDRRAETVIREFVNVLAEEGIEVIDPTKFLSSALVKPGLLTPRRKLTKTEMKDVEWGIPLAKTIADKDIGQTIVVKNRLVVAVEGIEGTDSCIKRAASYLDGQEGIVVVKVSRPNQDFRMDLPVIGLETIRTLVEAKAHCIAVSAGQTLFFDQEEAIKLAEENNISIYGVE